MPTSQPAPAASAPSERVRTAAQATIFAVLILLVGAGEVLRWRDPGERALALTRWLCGEQADWLPFAPWLLLAPLVWRMRHQLAARRSSGPASSHADSGLGASRPTPSATSNGRTAPGARTWLMGFAVAGLSFGMSAWTAQQFVSLTGASNLPPAYHDEFSYLFQAQTFLAGRLWSPGFEPQPELFDQMHVLNEGRFASRYFPGAGLWMAPFVWLGHPWVGQWLAGALAALFVFWTGWEVGGTCTACLCGLLCALSPGVLLFSNLLLAHHPTLVGLTLFTWMYLRAERTGRFRDSLCGAVGLTFAMLCRPMTAFGVGLPFGAALAWRLLTGNAAAGLSRRRLSIIVAWGAPLLAGFGMLLAYNAAITGDPWLSPYQLYTRTYTPRHVYGFYNVTRGEQHLGPKVLDNYDRWAEELTPALAVHNVQRRLIASMRWTLGIVPVAAAALVLLASRSVRSRGVGLIAAAIASLHAVHVPYWFEGIMGWHYVFESAPLWLILVGEATRRLCAAWRQSGHSMMCWWWGGVLATAVCVNLVPAEPLWRGRLAAGIDEVSFSRRRYAAFFETANALARRRPIVVFVEPDPADRHIDYVVNEPSLSGPVLIARHRPDRLELDRARRLFPDREAYLFRAATREWQRVR